MRLFKSGATRSNAEGKISYYGFRHPLVELSFGKYMLRHQVQEDGKKREPNNWWRGWNKSVSIQSLVRHCEDLQAIYAGYQVVKVRNKDGETTHYIKEGQQVIVTKDDKCEVIGEEECVNAIKFNCNAYLLNIL